MSRNAFWVASLGASIALAHVFDLLLYNEETLVALCFALFCGALWYGAGDALGEALRARGVALAREWAAALEAQREAWQRAASPWREAHRTPAVLGALRTWTAAAGAAGRGCGEARLRARVHRALQARAATLRAAPPRPWGAGAALGRLCAAALGRGGASLRAAQLEGALARLEATPPQRKDR